MVASTLSGADSWPIFSSATLYSRRTCSQDCGGTRLCTPTNNSLIMFDANRLFHTSYIGIRSNFLNLFLKSFFFALFCSVLFCSILSYCPFTMHLHTRQRLALRASILSTLLLTSPCEAYVNWLYPPSSSSNALAYNYNDVVYFTWDSNFTNPSLALWCATDDNYFARESIRLSYSPFILALQIPPFSFLHPSPPSRRQLTPETPVYTANVTTNGTDPQSFPYADAFNHTCHTSLYCHGSPACGPVGQSPEFALLHNHAAAAQTWGLSATASVGKAPAAAPTATSASSPVAAQSASASVTTSAVEGTATATTRASGGLGAGAKAGIGVGVALGAVAVVAALGFCVLKARRRGRMALGGLGVPEMMSGQRYRTHSGWVEPSRHEMDGQVRMNELQGTPQAELSSVASPVR